MDESVAAAISLYRAGEYRQAAAVLELVRDNDPTNLDARLYLGMAYQKVGRLADAYRELSLLMADCDSDDQRRQMQHSFDEQNHQASVPSRILSALRSIL